MSICLATFESEFHAVWHFVISPCLLLSELWCLCVCSVTALREIGLVLSFWHASPSAAPQLCGMASSSHMGKIPQNLVDVLFGVVCGCGCRICLQWPLANRVIHRGMKKDPQYWGTPFLRPDPLIWAKGVWLNEGWSLFRGSFAWNYVKG